MIISEGYFLLDPACRYLLAWSRLSCMRFEVAQGDSEASLILDGHFLNSSFTKQCSKLLILNLLSQAINQADSEIFYGNRLVHPKDQEALAIDAFSYSRSLISEDLYVVFRRLLAIRLKHAQQTLFQLFSEMHVCMSNLLSNIQSNGDLQRLDGHLQQA